MGIIENIYMLANNPSINMHQAGFLNMTVVNKCNNIGTRDTSPEVRGQRAIHSAHMNTF
jgi:hypothetical protein